jgi:hypothetical protein
MLLYSYDEGDYEDNEDLSYTWNDFKDNVSVELDGLDYPVTLEAQNSNWRGQTGYAEAEDFDQLINKVCSFDSSFIEFHKEEDEYYFKLATHDVPTGFCIYIKQGQIDE